MSEKIDTGSDMPLPQPPEGGVYNSAGGVEEWEQLPPLQTPGEITELPDLFPDVELADVVATKAEAAPPLEALSTDEKKTFSDIGLTALAAEGLANRAEKRSGVRTKFIPEVQAKVDARNSKSLGAFLSDAMQAKAAGDKDGYVRKVQELHNRLEHDREAGLMTGAQINDFWKRALGWMKPVEAGVNAPERVTARQAAEHKRVTDHTASVERLTREAREAKAAGNRTGYQKAMLALADLEDQVLKDRQTVVVNKQYLRSADAQIDDELDQVTPPQTPRSETTLNTLRAQEAAEKERQTKEWLDPSRIWTIRAAIDFKVRVSGVKDRAAREHLSDSLILEVIEGVPESIREDVLTMLLMPKAKLDELVYGPQRKPQQNRSARPQRKAA